MAVSSYSILIQDAMTLLADIYLKSNDWGNATNAADMVLKKDKRSNKARLVKAEALFNVCQFEHAMVHFNRGMVNILYYANIRLSISNN